MELRDCAAIFHGALGNWPPVWVRKGDHANEILRGELGTLRDVRASLLKPYHRCFLIMQHNGAEYVGCLLFRDDAACKNLYKLLLHNRGRPIEEIGGIDVSAVLRPRTTAAAGKNRQAELALESASGPSKYSS